MADQDSAARVSECPDLVTDHITGVVDFVEAATREYVIKNPNGTSRPNVKKNHYG